VAAEVSLDSH